MAFNETGNIDRLSENRRNSFNPDKVSDMKFNFTKQEGKTNFNKVSDMKFNFNKKENNLGSKEKDKHKSEIEKNKMEPPVVIKFRCPEGANSKEFERQIKAQERGLNSQTVAENKKNREAYVARKEETGNGRDVESKKAQKIARQKAFQSRIETNQKNGMSYSDAKKEAESWIKTQAALHNPDQIAGGDPSKVSRMGDAKVNSSIGVQWKHRVDELKTAVDDYSNGKTSEELANTKMNVKLIMEK